MPQVDELRRPIDVDDDDDDGGDDDDDDDVVEDTPARPRRSNARQAKRAREESLRLVLKGAHGRLTGRVQQLAELCSSACCAGAQGFDAEALKAVLAERAGITEVARVRILAEES